MSTAHRRRANNALGAFAITVLFGLETVVAHQVAPSAWSPLIWSLLGLAAVGSLVAHRFFVTRHQRGRR